MLDLSVLVIGTAGHIDHGKSRLVKALTGTDPDRLPEEQARGMTIDLGFAHRTAEGALLSFVDVPGHERFLRNMVAGATGIDLALLVVAADDSVMPQTREHAEVLSLLGVERCVIVLTKMDLVDEDWAAAVEDEARQLLAAVGLAPLACVRTSAETGRGLAELLALLARVACDPHRARPTYRWFRLPIDRAFSVAGRGTVVTGSVAHGALTAETELELWPAGQRVRARDLQMHHDAAERTAGRTRLGVNLAAVPLEQVVRGHELASPGYLQPTHCLDVHLSLLRMPGKALRQTLRLRLHIATSEVLAELRLLERPAGNSISGVLAQLRTTAPVVATWGQRFILRDEAATRTLGGGRVLRPFARPWTSRRPAHAAGLEVLLAGAPRDRLLEVLRDSGWETATNAILASAAGLPDADEAARLIQSLVARGEVVRIDSGGLPLLVHAGQMAEWAADLQGRVAAWLADNPRTAGVPRSEWVAWMPHACPERLRPALAEWLLAQAQFALSGDHVVPPGHGGALPPADEPLLHAALAELDAAGYQPPDVAALACRTPRNSRRLDELLDWAAARGQVLRVADGFWMHARHWHELVTRVTAALADGRKLTVSEIRTLLGSTRKYVVPIVERLDALGLTRRVGDSRMLGPKASRPAK